MKRVSRATDLRLTMSVVILMITTHTVTSGETQERQPEIIETQGGRDTEGVRRHGMRTVRVTTTAECEGAGWSMDVILTYLL